jgi:hypothetical protein
VTPRQCPKCQSFHGNDWSQCKGSCPMEMSPHYSAPVTDDDGPASMDYAAAKEAASRIYDYTDNNLSMFDACCDETPQAARDLRGTTTGLHLPTVGASHDHLSRMARRDARALCGCVLLHVSRERRHLSPKGPTSARRRFKPIVRVKMGRAPC